MPLQQEEFATWLVPREVLRRVSEVIATREAAVDAIVRRLQGGVLHAAAKSCTWGMPDRAIVQNSITLVPPEHWRLMTDLAHKVEFWQVGDVRFFFGERGAAIARTPVSDRPNVFAPTAQAVTYFVVQFDPNDVGSWLADLPPPRQLHKSGAPSLSLNRQPKLQRLRNLRRRKREAPLPDLLLRGWHDLYRRSYSGAADATTHYAPLAGCFPASLFPASRSETYSTPGSAEENHATQTMRQTISGRLIAYSALFCRKTLVNQCLLNRPQISRELAAEIDR